MRVLESRRLTGPSLVLDRSGTVLDLEVEPARREAAVAAWRDAAGRLLAAVGWSTDDLRTRPFRTGVSLAFAAPLDGLYAATEINEAAWAAAERSLGGGSPAVEPGEVERLRQAIAAERNPRLLALRAAARERAVTFLYGEDEVSVGTGRGVRVWPERALPDPADVDWTSVHDVPAVLVTGSNGKTTVVRLLAAMAAATGRITGLTSTDAVWLAGRTLDSGDWSGPSGARLLLRQRELEVAVLETARGGLLRRGLQIERANAAVVTNVANDHLGEFGVDTLEALAETKLLVARAVGPRGRLVVNADDPVLSAAAARLAVPTAWFSLDAGNARVSSGIATTVEDGTVVLREPGRREAILPLAGIPLTMGGAARHNVANVLAALAAAGGIGVDAATARETLGRFGLDPGDNPGRANLLELGGLRILVDYAHNPHGMRALAEATRSIPSARRLVLLGQAGDRGDDAIRELAGTALELRPDRVIAKEMDQYLRGRAPGEVPGLIVDEIRRLGMAADRVTAGGREPEAVREALAWGRPGDLLILALHQDRDEVFALFDALRARGWTAGEPIGEAGATA